MHSHRNNRPTQARFRYGGRTSSHRAPPHLQTYSTSPCMVPHPSQMRTAAWCVGQNRLPFFTMCNKPTFSSTQRRGMRPHTRGADRPHDRSSPPSVGCGNALRSSGRAHYETITPPSELQVRAATSRPIAHHQYALLLSSGRGARLNTEIRRRALRSGNAAPHAAARSRNPPRSQHHPGEKAFEWLCDSASNEISSLFCQPEIPNPVQIQSKSSPSPIKIQSNFSPCPIHIQSKSNPNSTQIQSNS